MKLSKHARFWSQMRLLLATTVISVGIFSVGFAAGAVAGYLAVDDGLDLTKRRKL